MSKIKILPVYPEFPLTFHSNKIALEYVGKKIGAEKCEYVIEDVFEDGVEKVRSGITTIEELLRVAEPPQK